jgi:hypothetical protein
VQIPNQMESVNMSDFSQVGGRSQGAARQTLDLARTLIDDRLGEANASRAAEAARQASSGAPQSTPDPAVIVRRRPRLPITQRGIAGLDLFNHERDR